MQSTLNKADAAAWTEVAPLIDEAMVSLGATDRTALLLRFFENKTSAEVATALRTTEAAAYKRVNRALDKLRKILSKRGVTLTATMVAGALSTGSVHAAPAGLAATATASAVEGAAVSTTIASLVKGTLNMMSWLKLKYAAGVGATMLVAGGTMTLVTTETGGSDVAKVLRNSVAAYAALTSYQDEGSAVSTVGGNTFTHRFSIKLARPNRYRIEWQHSVTAAYTNHGAVWSDGRGDFLLLADGQARKQRNMELALSAATGVSGGASALVPGTFCDKDYLGSLMALNSARLLADESVNGVPCHVVAKDLSGGRNQTLWISKQDYLVRRIRTVTSAEGMKAALDEALRSTPELKGVPLPELTEAVVIEHHANIVVNPTLTEADFAGDRTSEAPEDIARNRVNDAKLWALGFRPYADEHGGQLPETFAEVKALPKAGLTELDDSVFEIRTTGNWNTIPNHGKTVLLRETEGRASPGGGFVRVYALADGHVEVLKSRSRDFSAAERQQGFVTR